jgi:hypothetical protein
MKFSKLILPFLTLCFIVFAACKKDTTTTVTPQKDLADTFLGKYVGIYSEVGPNGAASLSNIPTTITKKAATEVSIAVDLLGTAVTLNGTVKNDTLIELPIQTVNGQQMKSIGSGVLRTSNFILLKFTTKSATSSDSTRVTVNGTK